MAQPRALRSGQAGDEGSWGKQELPLGGRMQGEVKGKGWQTLTSGVPGGRRMVDAGSGEGDPRVGGRRVGSFPIC